MVLDIEAVHHGCQGETPLVPEAAGEADPVHAQFFDVLAVGEERLAEHGVLAKGFEGVIDAEFVGHDPGDFGGRGGFEELGLGISRRGGGHGDDEEVDALEGVGEGVLVIVVDFLDDDPVGDNTGAIGAGEGGHRVFAGFEEGFDEVFSSMAANLLGIVNVGTLVIEGGMHYLHRQWRRFRCGS